MQGKGRRAPRISLSDTTPPAPEGFVNVKWQSDALGNRSGYVPDSEGGSSVSDTAYGASWDGVTTVAPSKNAVYDKIESLESAGYGNPFSLTTYPDYSTFTAVNDSSCTHGEASNGLLYIRNSKAAGGNLAMLVKANPGATSTTTGAIMAGMYVGATNEHLTGITLYDTGSTKAIIFGIDHQSGGAEPRTFLNIQYWDAPGTYSSEPVKLALYAYPVPLFWLRIVDDGSTNRKFQISFNGVHFEDAYSTARTTHFTSPDRVGVGCVRWVGSTYPAILSCASFSAVSP